jgi:hypothetical protein
MLTQLQNAGKIISGFPGQDRYISGQILYLGFTL